MAKYKVLSEFFYRDQMQKVGSEIDFDGEPGENLEAVDDAAKAREAEARARREAKRAALQTPSGAIGLSPEVQDFLANIDKRLTEVSVKVAAMEASPAGAVDTSNLATKSELATISTKLDSIAVDVQEHDAGLTLVHDRLVEVEGIVSTASKPAGDKPADAPASADTKPSEPPPPQPEEPPVS